MEIVLIRHTTPDIAKGICYGQSDIPLAKTFEREAELIRIALASGPFPDAVFSSPLSRCQQLASFLSPASFQVDDRLMELHFGTWEMTAWNSIDPLQLDPWMRDFVHTPCPGGESYMQLYKRTSAFLDQLRMEPLERVWVITHGGVIRAALAHCGDTTLENSFDRKIGYGTITRLHLS